MDKKVGIHIGADYDAEGTKQNLESITEGFVKLLETCAKLHMDQDTTKHVITQFASQAGVHHVNVSGCSVSGQ